MEASCQGNEKLKKEERKLFRKQMKASRTLLRHEGIETVSHPTQSLVVANGGLGNGVSRQQLLEVLMKCGSVAALLMPPNKPYAFVTFGSTEEALMAHTTINGFQLQTEDQAITLYLNFVEKVDCKDSACQKLPAGLRVVEEFVSSEEEQQLLSSIDWGSDMSSESAQKTLKHRRVKHYGYEFRYDNNDVDKDSPLPGGLPEICEEVLERCLEKGYVNIKPDQLTVNQYEPGQGIPPHVDTHSPFEDTIISLSLGAKTVMDFKHPDGRSVAVMLPRRSLLVMTGESRYLWTHGITPRKFDVVPASEADEPGTVSSDIGDLTINKRETRTSFTFRKVRRTPCDCAYPSVCDSQGSKNQDCAPSVPQSDGDASRLERKFVHKVYEQIADHFSNTRHSPWPKVVEFLKSLPRASVVADIGCGNGKYLGVNQELCMMGCDRSRNLVDICGERKFQAFASDALLVPLRSGICDACISIAVIHHFSTEERRLAAINELVRLLRPGGRALIYVWAMEQEYKKQKSKYLKKNKAKPEEAMPDTLQQEFSSNRTESSTVSSYEAADFKKSPSVAQNQCELRVHMNRTSFHSQDLLVPWHLKGSVEKNKSAEEALKESTDHSKAAENAPVFHRFYHVFCEGELENLCRKIENVTIYSNYYDQGNWCVIIEKCKKFCVKMV
ncbi:alkylated DNA repair protein alkB-like protein 8 [Huso huso]|uniref:tRNA (carboxymethyluridine(34)-5-O)-methyltransferase n=1 Tax=Huso huso TaxID=61971 RepID=A0ABR0ZMB6_HUSHU